jgi:FAD/FMN-containing dehydrogenase
MRRRDFVRSSLSLAALWPTGTLLSRLTFAAADAAANLPALTLTGATTTLLRAELAELASAMRGALLLPDQRGYDEARKVWNGMIDKRPALIARCAAPSDVMLAVNFAREHQLLTAVRGGGHSFSGKSTCDGGMVIDLSPMQSVRVEPFRRLARIEGGAPQAHLDRETRPFDLVTTTGTVSLTGVAGLTLGGGFGRVARRFGLACDNLVSIDVVAADGRLVTASERENADLFWGVRGGGGNFGVATSFEYRLHPMEHTILGGNILWPLEQAADVLRFYADYSMQTPDELNLDLILRNPRDGDRFVGVQVCWSSGHADGEKALRDLRAFGRPMSDTIAARDYVQLQASADAGSAPGARRYVKSGFFSDLHPAIDAILEAFRGAEPGTIGFAMQQGGGAISRIPTDATAFANRDTRYWANLSTRSQAPQDDAARIAAVREAWKLIEPHTSGFYVNATSEEQERRVSTNYGTNYPRLAALKQKYDPGNLFRLNANIVPKGSSPPA